MGSSAVQWHAPMLSFQYSQAKMRVWIRQHNTSHSQILNGWMPSRISTRWIIFLTVAIAAHWLAVIVNTAIFHPSGYQCASLSDTELCWSSDCLPAFGVFQRSVLLPMWCAAWILSAYQTVSHWKVNALPAGSLLQAGEVICQCLGQQIFIKTENQQWWWVCVCGVGGWLLSWEAFLAWNSLSSLLPWMAGCCLRKTVLTKLVGKFKRADH